MQGIKRGKVKKIQGEDEKKWMQGEKQELSVKDEETRKRKTREKKKRGEKGKQISGRQNRKRRKVEQELDES